MKGLISIIIGVAGTVVMWAALVAAFCVFAASVLYVAGRALPLRPRERR